MTLVGAAVHHDAALLHVTGGATYVDDIPAPRGTLHLAFGLSETAHGRIKRMDLSRVRAAPSVVAVITSEDLPGANDVSPVPVPEPLLAEGTVHFAGQPLFIVAAESHHAARAAARKAEVDYDPLPAILTFDEAIAANADLDEPMICTRGNPDAAISSASHIVEGRIEIGGQEHFYLEGQIALALPSESGTMTVQCSSQHPTEIQHVVANALGVPMSSVKAEVRRMGGAFGGKESQGNSLACACAIAARLTGKACKMRYDRDDDMVVTGKRHEFRIEYRAGFHADGRIAGVDFKHFARCGWSHDLSIAVADRAVLHSDNTYFLPSFKIVSRRLRTNTQSATAFRGFGGPQGTIGIERVMDHGASALGLEREVVRRVNYYSAPDSAPPQTTHYGMAVEDCVIGEITDELLEKSEFAARQSEIREWNAANPCIKRGIALTPVKFGISFTLTHFNQGGALVQIYKDGSIRMNHGGTEMGQGLFVKIAQIAADAFGQPLEAVQLTATDTSKVPNTSATAASSGSDLNGMAVKNACDELVGRMLRLLAELHQTSVEEVQFADGLFRVGNESYEFRDAVRMAYEHRVSLSATGFYSTPKVSWDRMKCRGRPFYYFAYGAAVSEVAVDLLTGENRLLRSDILHETGKSLNPAIDIGQIEGGFVQCAGWLTTEELVWDDNGRLKTHAPSTYKIPACSDRPPVFNVHLWDKGRNREDSIYRSKAVGEPPFVLGISVLAAISDAIGSCGDGSIFPELDAPATPERVYWTAKRMRGSAS